jgi:hypothetical protein
MSAGVSETFHLSSSKIERLPGMSLATSNRFTVDAVVHLAVRVENFKVTS